MSTQNHCCEVMENCVMDSKSNIIYVPYFREYIVATQEPHIAIGLYYCPWCAKKFPKDLREEFFNIFYRELHLKREEFNIIDTPGLPEEFKTDEWWKKRGL